MSSNLYACEYLRRCRFAEAAYCSKFSAIGANELRSNVQYSFEAMLGQEMPWVKSDGINVFLGSEGDLSMLASPIPALLHKRRLQELRC